MKLYLSSKGFYLLVKSLLKNSSYKIWLPAGIIFLIAAIFRTTFMSLMEFKSDEAVNLYLALRPYFGYPPAPGSTVSSLGVLNPPLINYLIYPLSLISTDPKNITLLIGMINSLMLAVFFVLFKKYYGFFVTFVASLILAFSPWQILYSRKIWAQDFVFLFLIPLLFSIQKIVVDKDKRFWFLFIISGMFLVQVYVATVFFVIFLSLFLIKYISKRSIPFIIAGVCIGLLPLIPYAYYQYQFGCPDCSTVFNAQDKVSDAHIYEYGKLVFQVLGTGGFYTIFGSDYAQFLTEYPISNIIRYIHVLYFLLIPIGMVLFFKRYASTRIYLYITLLLPILYYLLKVDNKMHYFIVLMPLLSIFISGFFASLWNQSKTIGKLLTLCLITILLASSVGYIYFFYMFLGKHGGTPGEYGAVYAVEEMNKKERLATLLDDKSYEEQFLLSFIPAEYALSTYPFSKMVYSPEIQNINLEKLEEKYEQNPQNIKARNLLIAFYSYPQPSKKTINELFTKSFHKPEYSHMYQIVKDTYAAKNYRAFYQGLAPFLIDYPTHWKITASDNDLNLKNNNYTLSITKETSRANQKDLLTYEKYRAIKDDLVSHLPTQPCHSIPCIVLSVTVLVDNIPIQIDVTQVENNSKYQDSPHSMLEEILISLWKIESSSN